MAKTIFIQITTAGPNVGPFNIFAVDGTGVETGPFETNISKAALTA